MFLLYKDEDGRDSNKFEINNLVTVDGYKGRIFVIDKYYSKDIYTGGRRAFEIVYTVRDVNSGETMTAFPEDMQLYTSKADEQDRINKHKETIDTALDSYNNRMFLYNLFQDEEYKEKADEIMKLLGEYISEYERGS